jgi:hypothetical protein
MSNKTFDNITRSALWTAYNNICFYCNRPLDWGDLNIDHIIPENLLNDEKKYNQIKSDFELDENFEINDLINLVPSHSKCNQRKSDELFPKSTTLFYLGLTLKSKTKIETEIEKLKRRKNKGQIISKLQSALSTNLITQKELKGILIDAESNNWNTARIKLPIGIEFIDEAYDMFYLNTDCSTLVDKKLLIGGECNQLELVNGNNEKLKISTLREWKDAKKAGFKPSTNYDIKISSNFTFLEDFFEVLEKAKMPKVSFISEPWIDIDNLDYLSPGILHDFEGTFNEFTNNGSSIGDLVRQGIIKVNKNNIFKISLEYEGMETSLIEQFRADFNNDGVEDIFVRGWTRAVGGSYGYGFTTILTKFSDKHLIEEIKLNS